MSSAPLLFIPTKELSSPSTHSCSDATAKGYCSKCEQEHFLNPGSAHTYCLELMDILHSKKRVDLNISDTDADPHFSTNYLFGEARGQMFGIMTCHNEQGDFGILRAFSGQYDGIMDVQGWMPPLFNIEEINNISIMVEKEIKALGRKIETLEKNTSKRKQLELKRKKMSQDLMKEIHSKYNIRNFRGEKRSLKDVFINGKGIPTGTGDCCAPKLLNYAAHHNLTPLGLAEFYWGKENRSGTKQHGQFYPACEDKCQPILGFMLCGLNE